ncbi:MAG: T9SS type A sorting domain-containing protein, partial [Bacteroidales bacterium]|nr:T9SS type A sorting domain-containing protein [Bacteroidales bacterium]
AEVVISGNDVLEVEAEEGAMIALSVEGELIGIAQSTGGSTNVNFISQIPGTDIKIVITKQNYFRHMGYIMVIAPEGPYVVKTNYVIKDAQGNNNGLVDFGETISLDFGVKNLGTEEATNIVASLSTTDEFTTINDNTQEFGSLSPDEESTIEDAFNFTVSNDIPDNHYIVFAFSATDGDSVWESAFSIKANAPIIEILDMVVTELNGDGNGSIDPGENALINIQFTNNGHAVSAEGLSTIISSSEYLTINSSEFAFDAIGIDAIMTAEFNVSVSEDISTGSSIIFTNTVDAGSYSAVKEFGFKVGLIIEDWETGDFNKYGWINSGNGDWTISDNEPYEGTYCAKSGAIGDNQKSTLSITYYVSFDDKINFFAKVSSENNYDYLKFYIDGSEKGNWSGIMDWTEVSFDVTEGEHTFKWEYKKDASATGGDDCAWVDYITLPTMLFPKADAGEDGEICQGGSTDYQLNAIASDYESLSWTTLGDGTFSQSDIVDPVYSMGANDETNGFVELALTAVGANGDVTNTMLLSIVEMPLQADMPQGETNICYAAQEQLFTIVDGAGHYIWTIIPAEAAEITTHENIAYVSFNEEFVGEASLSVTAFNVCGEADASEALVLHIAELATADFMGDTESCIGSEAILNIELTGVAPWNVELTDENGAEIYFEATESPYELVLNTDVSMTYTLVTVKDANNCDGLASGTALVTVNDLPTAILTAEDAAVCAGEIIEVELALTGIAPWMISLGNGSNISQEYEVTEASEIVEFIAPYTSFDLQVNTISDANECLGTSEGVAAIDVKASPMVDLGADTAICMGNIYLLDAQNLGETYAWSTGETTQTIEVDETMADSNNDLVVTVDVTNATGCSTTDETIVHFKDCTGINELTADDVQLMPNPNTGRFILNIPSNKDITTISIHNNLGELITQVQKSEIQSQMNIDVSHLSNGVYFVIIRSSENQISKRFIIQK